MPTYQYACTACGEGLEAVQSFSDDPLTECPACGGRLRKVFSSVGVVFKGSGFYRTDSRATGNGSASGDSKAKETATSSGSDKGASGSTSGGSSGAASTAGSGSGGGSSSPAATSGSAA